MMHGRVGGTAGMGLAGVQINGLLESAAQAVEGLSEPPAGDPSDMGLHVAPDDVVCVVCLERLLPRHAARRSPAGLRHECCP